MAAARIRIPEPTSFESLISLKGRCAIVTGGGRGLGEAIVHRLSQAGASVVLTGRGLDALKKVEADVAATGGQALGMQADLASLPDSQRVIDKALERFGRVDILVNNAAVFPGAIFLETTDVLERRRKITGPQIANNECDLTAVNVAALRRIEINHLLEISNTLRRIARRDSHHPEL